MLAPIAFPTGFGIRVNAGAPLVTLESASLPRKGIKAKVRLPEGAQIYRAARRIHEWLSVRSHYKPVDNRATFEKKQTGSYERVRFSFLACHSDTGDVFSIKVIQLRHNHTIVNEVEIKYKGLARATLHRDSSARDEKKRIEGEVSQLSADVQRALRERR